MEKIVKARKPWTCECCDRDIKPGQYCLYGEYREPRYQTQGKRPVILAGRVVMADDDVQVGIRYVKYRLCLDCGELGEEKP